MTVSEARAELPALLDRVARGEEITITRHGQPAAVVVRPDTLRARRATEALGRADEVRERLARARAVPLADAPRLAEDYAEELVARVRAGRDAR